MSCGVDNLPDKKIGAGVFINSPSLINLNSQFERSVFYNDFSQLLENYRVGVVFDVNRGLDRELLNQNTRELNSLIVDTYAENPEDFKSKYPFTFERIENNPFITPAEVQQIIENNFLLPSTFIPYITRDADSKEATLYVVNRYYSPQSFSKTSMGSFCDLVPNIFAKFAQFQDIFGKVAAFASAFQNILSSLTNFSFASLIEGLKSKILSVVDNLVESIKKKIATFSSAFVDLARGANAIFTKIGKTKDKITQFLSENTIQNIKDKISGMISYAGSLFENLDIEEIQFLILRFCSFINGLENFFNGLTKPLEQIVSNYQGARVLFTSGDLATAGAIAAGATRLDRGVIESYIGLMNSLDPSIPVQPGISEYSYPPSSGSSISGVAAPADLARLRSGKIQDITQQEIDELPSWDQIKSGNQYFSYASGMPGDLGWGRADVTAKVMLMRLAKRWGRMTINSAYRSPEYNASVGGARNSNHMAGIAFDIGGVVRNEAFDSLAREIGFTGFGYYNSFTHIDIGNPRTWNG